MQLKNQHGLPVRDMVLKYESASIFPIGKFDKQKNPSKSFLEVIADKEFPFNLLSRINKHQTKSFVMTCESASKIHRQDSSFPCLKDKTPIRYSKKSVRIENKLGILFSHFLPLSSLCHRNSQSSRRIRG